ncbi:hypothetical protein P3X46_015811 [Hevea brasiliensis]|uniref:Uncharacterized protein n=1 Tax=Hevea brasiliensis TaxID=3981 RepID=A0ABQ9LX56_HEVBR|nr:hypothetical protein P3X46_015811 [Hevea brasiliensis]
MIFFSQIKGSFLSCLRCWGSSFSRRRRFRWQWIKHKNWKEQIEKACGSGLLFLRTETCSVVKVGKVSMAREEIVKNVVAAINGIAEIMPRKWGGIRSFHSKLLESLALPVYQALPDLKLKIEGVREDEEKEGEVEKERVKKDKVRKKKGRIHEIRYMDRHVCQ